MKVPIIIDKSKLTLKHWDVKEITIHFFEKADFFQEALPHFKLQISLDSQDLKAQIVAYLEISQLAFLQLNQLSQNTATCSCVSCQLYLTFC